MGNSGQVMGDRILLWSVLYSGCTWPFIVGEERIEVVFPSSVSTGRYER
jgi:hypothetical protein